MKLAIVVLFALVASAVAQDMYLTSAKQQSGDDHGETILVPQDSEDQHASAPKPPVDTTTQIGVDAAGQPLYQVKVDLPTACSCLVQPCACNQPGVVSTNTATFIEVETEKDPNQGVVYLGATQYGDRSRGETILSNAPVQITHTSVPAALQNPANHTAVATSAHGKPLYPSKIFRTAPCACAMADQPCQQRCAALLEIKSGVVKRLRHRLRGDPVAQAPAAPAAGQAPAASGQAPAAASDQAPAAASGQAPAAASGQAPAAAGKAPAAASGQAPAASGKAPAAHATGQAPAAPAAAGAAAPAAGAAAPAGGTAPSAINTLSNDQNRVINFEREAGTGAATIPLGQPNAPVPQSTPGCTDTLVQIHNSNLVQTINHANCQDKDKSHDKAGDMAAAAAVQAAKSSSPAEAAAPAAANAITSQDAAAATRKASKRAQRKASKKKSAKHTHQKTKTQKSSTERKTKKGNKQSRQKTQQKSTAKL